MTGQIYVMPALVMYVVYHKPTDIPRYAFVVRRMRIWRNVTLHDRGVFVVGQTIEEVRAALPLGLTRIERSADDDPVIYETWV